MTYPLFSKFDFVKAVYSDRFDGVSSGDFSSLNVAFHVGDTKTDVIQNQNIILQDFPNYKNLHIMKKNKIR